MSTIYAKIAGVEGEAENPEFSGQIECLAMRHSIDLPVVSAAVRVEGASTHGPIALTHRMDKASPILKQAALTGANLGEVELTRMRNIGGQARPTETVRLSNVFVVRVDVETLVDEATQELGDELAETFHLEYSDIRWSHKRYMGDVESGTVEGGWSTATQSLV